MTQAEAPNKQGVTLHHDAESAVATLLLDLPQPRNAFRKDDVAALSSLLDEALTAGARCIVIRGAGAIFSAGWDISSIDPATDDPVAMINDVVAPFCRKLRSLPVPTISAVNGPALGFGFGLAMCCDICFADAEGAWFGSPFRNIGMVPDTGTHFFLRDRLGHALAAELIYTGRLLSGAQAAALGLVNHAVPAGTVAEQADILARSIASGPTAAFRLSKEILLEQEAKGGGLDAVMDHEGRQLRHVFATTDLYEGIAAFKERRKAVFTGA